MRPTWRTHYIVALDPGQSINTRSVPNNVKKLHSLLRVGAQTEILTDLTQLEDDLGASEREAILDDTKTGNYKRHGSGMRNS
ncbi:hypothetical protein NDU88_003870 [Pleurodeles waltl]|uniref:Uncharacterized protein n=1 Tax=Pleurodeles waltl TaxID=8319 RepID=A0AAV7KWR0_PLEWA|nr:hypothetical protein NDU88_003870 [Pleurodeles waltl]